MIKQAFEKGCYIGCPKEENHKPKKDESFYLEQLKKTTSWCFGRDKGPVGKMKGHNSK